MVIESSNLCKYTRACLDPPNKNYGSVAFILTWTKCRIRVNVRKQPIKLF